jgi:hypothetical protein
MTFKIKLYKIKFVRKVYNSPFYNIAIKISLANKEKTNFVRNFHFSGLGLNLKLPKKLNLSRLLRFVLFGLSG